MARYSLGIFTVRMMEKASEQPVKLNELGVSRLDLFMLFKKYLNERESESSNDSKKMRVMDVVKWEFRGRIVSGIIRTGDYGYESDINEVETHETSYRKRKSEAEMLPFYFRLVIPKFSNEAVIVLQRFKNMGVKTVLENDLRQYLRHIQELMPYRLEINPLVPTEFLKVLTQVGLPVKLRFVKFRPKKDVADRMADVNEETDIQTEFHVIAKRGKSFKLRETVKKVITGGAELAELKRSPGEGGNAPDFDTVKIEFKLGRSNVTLDLSAVDKVLPYYDISDVETGADGHPQWEAINQKATDLMKMILRSIGVAEEDVI